MLTKILIQNWWISTHQKVSWSKKKVDTGNAENTQAIYNRVLNGKSILRKTVSCKNVVHFQDVLNKNHEYGTGRLVLRSYENTTINLKYSLKFECKFQGIDYWEGYICR